jgi:prepilin-type N-terminal cleavage/methylation domain-containing protein
MRIRERANSPSIRRGFTLIEIMLVVGILAIVMTMGLPAIYRMHQKEGLRQAVSDIVEVCSNARAQAILRGVTVELRIRPQEGTLDVSGAASQRSAESMEPGSTAAFAPAPRSGLSAHISDRLIIEMVDVNFIEYKDEEEARVRFHPNGTCDELTIVLRSEKNEFRKISLEVTTSLAMVETLGFR